MIALDALNFLLADVKDGLGPFLAVYLLAERHWDPAQIGAALTAAGVATVAARGPAGALVDAVTGKRAVIVTGALVVGGAAATMALWPDFWPVIVAQVISGIADAGLPPAVAAISLGIVGRAAFTRRVGRNEAFNHAGNAATALLAGLAGYLIAPSAVLWIVAVLAAASIAAALAVDGHDINHERARGYEDADGRHTPSGLRAIFGCRPLLLFTAAITLFHFANAAMLPLVGEKLAQGDRAASSLFIAACILTAQIVMVPMALLVGHKADDWGRKPIFLAGFAVLPLRGILFTLSDEPAYLICVQILDGIGAGIFGALFFIVVADLTKGTGRYNLAQGSAAACWGLGAALSNAMAGLVAARFGYTAAFLCLASLAAAAMLLFWIGVPETRDAPPMRTGA